MYVTSFLVVVLGQPTLRFYHIKIKMQLFKIELLGQFYNLKNPPDPLYPVVSLLMCYSSNYEALYSP